MLDSFCGTGHSTARLARLYPDHLVMGIDKSAQRLARTPAQARRIPAAAGGLRGHLAALAQAGLTVRHHYLLYPNPWPKPNTCNAAYTATAVSAAVAAGRQLELRSNWQLYVEEFGLAMHLAGLRGSIPMSRQDRP